MTRVLRNPNTAVFACLMALVVLLLLPAGSDVASAKKPPKPTPTPTPSPGPANPEIVYIETFTKRNRESTKIVTIEVDGGNKTVVLDCGAYMCADPEFSADGSKVVFTSDASGSGKAIYVMNIDGSDIRELVVLNGGPGEPSWSPVQFGGQYWIAFVDENPDPAFAGFYQVFAVDDAGQTVVQVTDQSFNMFRDPSWSNDGFLLGISIGTFLDPSSYHASALEMDLTASAPVAIRYSDLWHPDFQGGAVPCFTWSVDFSPLPGDYRLLTTGCNNTYIYDPGPRPFEYGPYMPEWQVDQVILETWFLATSAVSAATAKAKFSPDTTEFVLVSSDGIYRMASDGSEAPVQLATGSRFFQFDSPDWRPAH